MTLRRTHSGNSTQRIYSICRNISNQLDNSFSAYAMRCFGCSSRSGDGNGFTVKNIVPASCISSSTVWSLLAYSNSLRLKTSGNKEMHNVSLNAAAVLSIDQSQTHSRTFCQQDYNKNKTFIHPAILKSSPTLKSGFFIVNRLALPSLPTEAAFPSAQLNSSLCPFVTTSLGACFNPST